MDVLKKTRDYWKQIKDNEIDHGDILAYHLIIIMRKTCLWWTEEDYEKAPKWAKVLNIFLSIYAATCSVHNLVYLILHLDSKPANILLQDAALCMAGIVGSTGFVIFPYNRKRTSKLLKTINEINLDILKRTHNAQGNRRVSNGLFMALPILCIVLQVSGSMLFVMFAWEFGESGLPYFANYLHQPTPFSVLAFVDEFLHSSSLYFLMSLCTVYFTMYIEFILRISFHFRATAEDMRNLRSGSVDEEKDTKKLKSLIKDLNLLYWCVDEFNATLRFYIIFYVWLAFTNLGIYAAVILSIGSLMKSLQLLFFPFYLVVFIVSFCAIGQHLKDSADEVRVGIYDCNWYTAPIPFRKLVLNVLTRCTHETLFTASPFYDLDLALLTRVLKTTYSLVAVFGKAIN